MKTRHFLLVEDNVDVVTLTLEIFKKNNLPTHLHVVKRGQDGINFLMDRANTKDCELFPSLVLLDLNMPQMDGRETLKRIKQNPKIKNVPIVMLTSSQDPEDISSCYDLGVNGYVVKPTDYQTFEKTLLIIEAFWTRCNVPPPMCLGQKIIHQ